MRLYQEGFELDEATSKEFDPTLPLLPIAQWVGGNYSSIEVTTTTPHTNPNGDGGARSLSLGVYVSDRRHFHGPQLSQDLKYAWFGVALKFPDAGDAAQFGISTINGGFSTTAKQVDISLNFNGTVDLRLGGTIVASGSTIYSNGWHWFALEYFCHPSSGFMNLYVDDVLEIVHNASNTQGSSTFDFFNEVQVSLSQNAQVDDIVINNASLSYVGGAGGSGEPVVGSTITGGTSGATAVITTYTDDLGTGHLVLQPNIGDTTGPTGFILGETISDGSGWSATANQKDISSDGLDKNSGRPPENFLLLLRPTVDISTQLTGTDGDSVNNYQNVDDDPFGDTLTYNEGLASGLTDVYGLENLPFSPASIEAVEVVVYASRSGTIPGIEPGIDPGLGVTYGPVKPVGSGGTFAKGSEIFDINPDTDAAWTEGEVNASDIAIRLG